MSIVFGDEFVKIVNCHGKYNTLTLQPSQATT